MVLQVAGEQEAAVVMVRTQTWAFEVGDRVRQAVADGILEVAPQLARILTVSCRRGPASGEDGDLLEAGLKQAVHRPESLDSGGLHLVAELVGARGRRRRRSRPGAGVACAPAGGRPLGTPCASGNSKKGSRPHLWRFRQNYFLVQHAGVRVGVEQVVDRWSWSSWSSGEGGDVPASIIGTNSL